MIDFLNEEERRVLELEWYGGHLLAHADRLMLFVLNNLEEIQSLAGGANATQTELVRAVQKLVTQRGSVHLPSELSDQVKEMHNEIWYRGQKGDYDRSRIQAEWTALYAEEWRQWRITQYKFVAAHCADRIGRKFGVSPTGFTTPL